MVDQSQHWLLGIFGIFAWPSHRNLLDHEPPEDATTVGIYKLPFDEALVTIGPPHPKISNDHKYLSQKIGVEIAPTPICGKNEYMLFNDHLKLLTTNNEKITDSSLRNIAIDFQKKQWS